MSFLPAYLSGRRILFEELPFLTILAGYHLRGFVILLKSGCKKAILTAYHLQNAYDALVEKYNHLVELCQPFLDALKHFPELVQKFIEKVKERFTATEKATETKIKTQNKERG